MKKKYYNEAIIGNEKIVASFSRKGELLRFFYPDRDYRQFVDEMLTGIKINDSRLIYLNDDINNIYEQKYLEDTNILNTRITNTYFNIDISQTDFVSISEDVLIKRYKFTNNNIIDLDVRFLIYSKLLTNYNNMVGSKIQDNVFMQYSHNYTYSIFSENPISSYRLNNSKEEIKSGEISDKDYIGMAEDSAICYDIGMIHPGETKQIDIYVYINDNKEIYRTDDILKNVEKIKTINIEKEEKQVREYWQEFVKKHDGLNILKNKEKWQKLISNSDDLNENTYKKYLELRNIYIRTILLFPLLTNIETGGIIAALEVDEEKDKSGRYSYCWPRDAVFITKALDILKMEDITTKFYTIFAKNTQSENGIWEQRFYTDGRLAPCWGYQIDETASIIYGIYEHYKVIKDKEFLLQTYEMCKKAIKALEMFLSAINISNETKNEIELFEKYESYDLWEMHEGIHLYSLSAIYAAYMSMIQIEKELNIDISNIEQLDKTAQNIKKYCMENLCNKQDNTLKRNNKDEIYDISLLGSIIPFNMFSEEDKQINNTIEKMQMKLRTYTGGYLRFENDSYLNGNNPWVIATLWMALYNIKINNKQSVKDELDFVTKTATRHGLLAEQIDNETMKSKWVLGLGWSHAMYILTLSSLSKDLF